MPKEIMGRRTFLILAAYAVAGGYLAGAGIPMVMEFMNQGERREWIDTQMTSARDRFQALIQKADNILSAPSQLHSFSPLEKETGHETGPFSVPVFTNLPPDTVCIYLPGSEEIHAEQSMGPMLHWYYQFLLAKGIQKTEAINSISRFSSAVKTAGVQPTQEKRLSNQLSVMAQEGLYCLPWDLFSEQNRNPLSLAMAAGGIIKTLPPNTPCVLLGHSLGAMSQRIFLKLLQLGDIQNILGPNRVLGSVAISEGYYGDLLALILALNQEKINRLNFSNDAETGRIALAWFKELQTDLDVGRIRVQHIIEKVGNSKFDLSQIQVSLDSLADFTRSLSNHPESIGRVIRIAAESITPPQYIMGVSEESIAESGCTPVIVRSPEDPYALFSGIKGSREIQVLNKKGKDRVILQICRSQYPTNLPSSLSLSAHAKYPEVASLVFG